MTSKAESDAQRHLVVVVGLGGIGGGVAARLGERGHQVVGIDLDAQRARAWGELTGRPSFNSLSALDWGATRCVLVAVRTLPQVESVLSDEAVCLALRNGASVFVLTTLTPSQVRTVADGQVGARFFELPVSGGEVKARQGELTGLIAGPCTDSFEDAVLEDVFASVFRLDTIGAPSLLKLLNNTLAAHHVSGTAAALQVAHRHGVSASLASDVIAASSGASVAGQALFTLSENQVDLLVKDVRLLVQELGSSLLEPTPLDDMGSSIRAAQKLLAVVDVTEKS